MTPETTVSMAVIFAIIAATSNIIGIYFLFKNKRDKERDHQAEAYKRAEERTEIETQRRIENEKNFLKLNLKLDSCCNDIKLLARSIDKTSDIMAQIQNHIVVIDSEIEQHRKLIEDHDQRLGKLEENFNGQ